MNSPYCGTKKTPKNKNIGTQQQCINNGQLRRYGTFMISEKMKKSNKEQVEKTPIKIVSKRSINIPTDRKSTKSLNIPKSTPKKVIDNIKSDIENLNETPDEKEIRKDIQKKDNQFYEWISKKEAKDHYIVGNDFLIKILSRNRWQKYKKLTNNDIIRSFKFLFSDFLKFKDQTKYNKMLYPDWGRFILIRNGGAIGARDKLLINEYVYDHLTELKKKYPQPDGHISEPDKVNFDLMVNDIKKLKARNGTT